MVSQTFRVMNEQGLHLQNAIDMAKRLEPFQSRVALLHLGYTLDARNVNLITAACIKYNDEIQLQAQGPDEAAALAAAIEALGL